MTSIRATAVTATATTTTTGLQNVRNPASAACRQEPNFIGRKGLGEKRKRKKKEEKKREKKEEKKRKIKRK